MVLDTLCPQYATVNPREGRGPAEVAHGSVLARRLMVRYAISEALARAIAELALSMGSAA